MPHRSTSAAAIAFCLALLPGPGHADGIDIGGFFTSLAMVGTLGAAVERRAIAEQLTGGAGLARAALRAPARSGAPAGRGSVRRAAQLPAACARNVALSGAMTEVFSKTCLEREMDDTARLPRRCQARIPAFGRERTAYRAECLSRAGWRAL